MPIYDYSCSECGNIWESIEVWKSHAPSECPQCKSKDIQKIMGTPHVRMDSDPILHSIPDPSPPLEELRGKVKPGCEGGYVDKPYADPQLKNYTRRRDKYGNSIWEEKKRVYFTGQKRRRSSGEGT
jgi:putative FmdB family regulatory protein